MFKFDVGLSIWKVIHHLPCPLAKVGPALKALMVAFALWKSKLSRKLRSASIIVPYYKKYEYIFKVASREKGFCLLIRLATNQLVWYAHNSMCAAVLCSEQNGKSVVLPIRTP